MSTLTLPHGTLLEACLDDELHRIGQAHLLCVALAQGMLAVRNDAGKLIMVSPDPTVPAGQAVTKSLREWMGWA